MNDDKNLLQEPRSQDKLQALQKEPVTKNKQRFPALDFALIVIVLLCIVGIGFRGAIADLIIQSAPEETVVVRVKIDMLSQERLALMKEGDTLYLGTAVWGTLGAFSYENAKRVIEQTDENGNAVFATVEDTMHYTVTAEVAIRGNFSESGFVCLENENMYVGKILNISATSYAITVIITEIPRK